MFITVPLSSSVSTISPALRRRTVPLPESDDCTSVTLNRRRLRREGEGTETKVDMIHDETEMRAESQEWMEAGCLCGEGEREAGMVIWTMRGVTAWGVAGENAIGSPGRPGGSVWSSRDALGSVKEVVVEFLIDMSSLKLAELAVVRFLLEGADDGTIPHVQSRRMCFPRAL